MNSEQNKNIKKLFTLTFIPILLSIWFTALCEILNPNLIMILFILGMIMAIIKEYAKLILEE